MFTPENVAKYQNNRLFYSNIFESNIVGDIIIVKISSQLYVGAKNHCSQFLKFCI